MSDTKNPYTQDNGSAEELSLSDDRRVKTLSPGMLVVKRFFRNRVMLAAMFIFSFVGGMISPYGQDEQFYTYTYLEKEYVGVTQNEDFRYVSAEGQEFGSAAQAQFLMAQMTGKTEFEYKDVAYEVEQAGTDFYVVSSAGAPLAIAYKDIVNASDGIDDLAFEVKLEALRLYTNGEAGAFSAGGQDYEVDEGGNIIQGEEVLGYISRFVVQSKVNGVSISRNVWKKSLPMTYRNLPILERTERNIIIRLLMMHLQKYGLLCRRRRLTYTISILIRLPNILWERIRMVWIC